MVGLLRRDDGGVGRQHEVDAWVWHQVGLELGDVNVQCPVEAQAGRERADDLGDQPVQVGVGWTLNVQVAAANVIERFVVLRFRQNSFKDASESTELTTHTRVCIGRRRGFLAVRVAYMMVTSVCSSKEWTHNTVL